MFPSGNRMYFSDSEQELAKLPAEAPTCDAARIMSKVCAQAAEVEFLYNEAKSDPIIGNVRLHDLSSRLADLSILHHQLSSVANNDFGINKEINELLAEG